MTMWLKVSQLWPEIALLLGACAVLAMGLWRSAEVRKLCPWIAGLALSSAFMLAQQTNIQITHQPLADGTTIQEMHLGIAAYIKLAVSGVGLLLLLVAAGVPEKLAGRAGKKDSPFDPQHAFSGEFYAFFLMSLAGVMLTAGAEDLVWLFLALELVSLPTYIMVAISRHHIQAREAAVKYFFLGALAAAVFLYGFALIYGATGVTGFAEIRDHLQKLASESQPLPPLLIIGMVLALVGVSFKIAAVPMHFYVADVYQGAAAPVSAFLAFVPKVAGFVAMIALMALMPQPLPGEIRWLLWIMAAATMTAGNVLGLLQNNVKRALAYSSVAHSGYMLVALCAVASAPLSISNAPEEALDNGVGAVLFYLVAYGVATLAAFAVLAALPVGTSRTGGGTGGSPSGDSRRLDGAGGDEAQEYEDITGSAKRHPILAAILLVSLLSLLGLPPLAGFVGKLYLFGAAINYSGAYPELLWLVIIGVLNSAISAVYYLRIAAACYFGDAPRPGAEPLLPVTRASSGRVMGAGVAALLAIILGLGGSILIEFARRAAAGDRAGSAIIVADELGTQAARHDSRQQSLQQTQQR